MLLNTIPLACAITGLALSLALGPLQAQSEPFNVEALPSSFVCAGEGRRIDVHVQGTLVETGDAYSVDIQTVVAKAQTPLMATTPIRETLFSISSLRNHRLQIGATSGRRTTTIEIDLADPAISFIDDGTVFIFQEMTCTATWDH